MEDIRIDKKETMAIKMPTQIRIGDPDYFEEHGDDFKYVYSKTFRGRKDWVGKLIITEEVDVDYAKETGRDFVTVIFKAIFAPDETFLKVYEDGNYYTRQKSKVTEIGVDCARYLIEINDKTYVEIDTGSDGLMGTVVEHYTGGKLEGIVIDLTGLDVNDFERFSQEIKYVFGK